MTDIETAFAAAMAAYGLHPPGVIADGQIHRFDGPDERQGKRSAWYRLYPDGVPAGSFGDWRSGLVSTWCAKSRHAMTQQERAALRERVHVMNEAHRAERAQRHTQARAAVAEHWERAGGVKGNHPYVCRKGIHPAGTKQLGEQLLVPLRDMDGVLHSMQYIRPDGDKKFKTGGRKTGCFCAVGEATENAPVMLIAEGWATACSLREATDWPVFAAMDAGNLLPVAKAVHARYPAAHIVLCADDDYRTDGNPGLTKAKEVAGAAGGVVAVPDFGDDRPEGATDFNDLHAAQGLAAVKACVDAALVCSEEVRNAAGAMAQPEEVPTETDDEAIERLAKLSPMAFDRVCTEEARRLKVKTTTLARAVKEARGDAEEASPLREVEPWAQPVDGAALLSEIARTVPRFIVCDTETATATAIWVAMTWFMEHVDVAPIAAITAPEKRCGKSQLLTLIGKMAYRPLFTSNVTPAALYRMIEAWQPTLLIDEADAFARENEELRGVLNAGHTRDTAYVLCTVGDDHTPKQFALWGAKATAGIGHLADTLMDRAVELRLRRKTPGEQVEKLRHAESGLFDTLAAKLARWSEDNAEAVRAARPDIPEVGNDRAADNWEPLLQIADVAGGTWPDTARRAMLKLCGSEEGTQSSGAELLENIRDVFDRLKSGKIFSVDLLEALHAEEESPWATWNRGKPMTLRQLAKKLSGYNVASVQIRIGYETKKGDRLEQFTNVFDRYLHTSPIPPSKRNIETNQYWRGFQCFV